MYKTLGLALVFSLWLTLPAEAVERFISPSGAGSTCLAGTPCSWATAFAATVAGDIITALPGTYSTDMEIQNKSGTASNHITFRAQNPAVNCPNPTGDPDGCMVNLLNRSIVDNGARIRLSGSDADFWDIEGFEITGSYLALVCDGLSITNGPMNNRWRFMHLDAPPTGGAGSSDIQSNISHCNGLTFEHSYITRTIDVASGAGGYPIRLWSGSQNVIYRNMYISGQSFGINARNLAGPNITIERLVCEGVRVCLELGFQFDRSGTGGTGGGQVCNGALMTDGNTANIVDGTISNITVRRVFVRPSTAKGVRYGLFVGNIRNLDAQDLFFANLQWDAGSSGIFAQSDTVPTGNCGQNPGNNLVRGVIVTNPNANCTRLFGNGWPSNLRIENMICHNAGTAASFGNAPSSCTVPPLETCQHPITTLRNNSYSTCSGPLSGNVAGRLTQDHNNVFSCGSMSGTGNIAVNPQLAGPTTVSTPDVAAKISVQGARLWNWDGPGGYQEIINNFRTTNAALTNAGTGTAPPCTGAACDIGINEFFPVTGAAVWASCALIDAGVTPPPNGGGPPWISGRGLVIDVDCTTKKFVIGRCTDPLNAATCDTDVYIRKAAYVRKKRVNSAVTLASGATGSPTDTSGVCWRTRATVDFTESLEDLNGIWVDWHVDPDGGTFTCPSNLNGGLWAFQGHE